MAKNLCILSILLFCLGYTARGQAGAYNRLSVDIGGATSILENSFTNNWNASPSLHLGLRAPYHLGNLEAGARYTHYSSGNANYQDASFTSFFVYVGWEYALNLSDKLSVAPGLRFGNSFLTFQNPATYPAEGPFGEYVFDPHESEFAYELFTRLQYKLGDSPWRLHSSFSYNHTLTYHPMPVGLLSVGISRSFETPSWFKDFLQ